MKQDLHEMAKVIVALGELQASASVGEGAREARAVSVGALISACVRVAETGELLEELIRRERAKPNTPLF